ncbi:hypothetical protein VTJ04DRAFT_3676 [Mycothermus thermophilus]|uniref:uncharacterized protein n=1 Tax=Humicola insolens TaxID=85995 RepID=UPI00374246D3
MPSLFGKSGSASGRAKARHKSIRGTISAPIPIPRTPEDDDFPIRTHQPITKPAPAAEEEEFPIRTPGSGIARPLPPNGDVPDEALAAKKEVLDPVVNKEQQVQGPDHDSASGSSSRSRSSTRNRHEEETKTTEPAPADARTPPSTAGGGQGDSAGQEAQQEPPATPQSQPPSNSNSPAGAPTSAARPPSRPHSRSPTDRVSSHARKPSPLGASPVRSSPPPPAARRATNPVLGIAGGSAAATMRYSVVSDVPSSSRQTAHSKEGPQRKKSTFRSALGRLFGRGKKKTNSTSVPDFAVPQPEPEPERQSRPLGAAQHRSDPSALSRPGQRSPKRSASLPLSEYDRPLRSHSIGPDDIMAIESARNSLHADAAGIGLGTIRRRAATAAVPSALSRPPPPFNREFGAGLSPRPASAHGRGSRAGGRAGDPDPSEIGRAITSDSSNGLRRRSRSLSGLQDFAAAGSSPSRQERRRSDEIRYWRESYDPGFLSPLSSNAQDDIDDTGVGDAVSSAPGSPAAERPQVPKTPPQAFNFGLMSKDMEGMKITRAADLDTRLANLEARTLRLEGAVDKLYHHVVPGQDSGLNFGLTPGPKDTAAPDTRPTSSRRSIDTDAQSHISFDPSQTGFLQPPPVLVRPVRTSSLSPNALSPTFPTPMRLPEHQETHSLSSGGATVRGPTYLPDQTTAAAAAAEEANAQRDALIAQLRRDLDNERAARLRLEAQVKKLAERVNSLSSTMFAMVRGPSEARSHERLATPATPGGGAGGATPGVGASSPLQSMSVRSMSSSSVAAAVIGTATLAVPVVGGVPREEQMSVFETDDDDDEEDEEATEEDEEEGDTTAETQLTRHETASSSRLRQRAGSQEDGDQRQQQQRVPVVSYGAFGDAAHLKQQLAHSRDDVDDDDDDDSDDDDGRDGKVAGDGEQRKTAARTLSLSQLTLGKGQRAQV